eukprot:GHVS01080102.1.p1 GENE.GHVS01080102.1~~GHVS01080102.1.p1  ORF type:complete len:200 (-),score=28.86 GHVS01080102.1:332-931(-)
MSTDDLVEVDVTAPRGLRTAKFLDDVDAFMVGKNLDSVLGQARELLEKFRMMEKSHQREKSNWKCKIPELQEALQAVEMIDKFNTNPSSPATCQSYYKLAESVFAQATVPKTANVKLWLGASTMMEYPAEQAKTMLQKNLSDVKEKLDDVTTALEFARAQIVVCEVNVARIYNYGVKIRQQARETSDNMKTHKKEVVAT